MPGLNAEAEAAYLAEALSSIFERFGRVIHHDDPPESRDQADVELRQGRQ